MSEKLIYADELLKRTVLAGEIRNPHMEVIPAYFVREAPAVDAVEVVRCKDCRFYFHHGKTSVLIDGKNVKAGWCQRRIRNDEEYRMTLNDFCSYGERRMMYEASGSAENCREDGLRSQGAGLR